MTFLTVLWSIHTLSNKRDSDQETIILKIRSAPSLKDLLNEENITPSLADKEALEELLFAHPDLYDLAETERLDFGPSGIRSQTVFAISEYIKLGSPALAQLIQPSKTS
ncbi:hypothetical protein GGX14DRAFT_387911 [Mycena pura]|uniref:Uncharacterized protein n=1 Tax=Mycena pura TaxID=153505 RepID=A0AAD6YMI8_9AGAR|nr:hypothetical protein GGX14DRAFT_387911 [Mycena pura]